MRRSSRTGLFGVYPARRGLFEAVFERKGVRKTLGNFAEKDAAGHCHDGYLRAQFRDSEAWLRYFAFLNFPNEDDRRELTEFQARADQKAKQEIMLRENARRKEPLTEAQKLEIAKLSATGTLADDIAKRLAVHIDPVLDELHAQRIGREENERRLNELEDRRIDELHDGQRSA